MEVDNKQLNDDLTKAYKENERLNGVVGNYEIQMGYVREIANDIEDIGKGSLIREQYIEKLIKFVSG